MRHEESPGIALQETYGHIAGIHAAKEPVKALTG
jgi:hypothetical protein